MLLPLEMETKIDTFLRHGNCGAKVAGRMWTVLKKIEYLSQLFKMAGCVNLLLPNLLYRNECWLYQKKYKGNLTVVEIGYVKL